MGFLHGTVSLYVVGTTRKSQFPKSSARSLLSLLIVLFVHVLIISYTFKNRFQSTEVFAVEPQVNLILLTPEKVSPSLNNLSLGLGELSVSNFENVIPRMEFPSIEDRGLDLDSPDYNNTFELPNKNSNKYKDVFDPKLRKRLQDLPSPKKVKPKIEYLGVGITLEHLGNGKCLYGDAFHKTGNVVKCGLDEGVQMMLNVERALDDPLGLK